MSNFNFTEAPYSQEAEEATLGAILINPNTFEVITGFLKADDFFFLRHSYIWQAMYRLATRKDQIDPLTVCRELEVLGMLNEIGGPAFLTQLMNNTPTSVHAEVYARLVERTSIRRALMKFGDAAKTLAMDETNDLEGVVGQVQKNLYDDVLMRVAGNDDKPLEDVLHNHLNRLEQMMDARRNNIIPIVGIKTGLKDYDELIQGMREGNLYILAARPGMGKTAFAMKALMNAVKEGCCVGMASIEMTIDQLSMRMVALETGISYQKQMAGAVELPEYEKIQVASREIIKIKDRIQITDAVNLTPPQLRAKAIYWQKRFGLDLLIVDYMQLMKAAGRHQSREQEVSEIARELKNLARELNIPVLALAQLSRAVEQRGDKRPMLSDLRESGDIENAADLVTFIYRDDYYNPTSEQQNVAEFIVGKNRHGATGTANSFFDKPAMHFQNLVSKTHYLSDGFKGGDEHDE